MLVNEFPPLQVGGAEIQAERLSAYLAGNGWQVWVVTRHAHDLPNSEQRNGFTILRPQTLGRGKIRTFTFMFFALLMLIKMRNRYQILHAHLAFGPAFVAVLVSRLLGKQVIVKLGGSGTIGDISTSLRTWRGRLRLAAIRRWSDVIVVLTEIMRNEAISAGIPLSKIRIFNNGIDTSLYLGYDTKDVAKELLHLDDKKVILFVGRLDPVKSLPTLLDALAISLNRCPDLFLLILGDGPERASLEAQVERLGLVSHVNFEGNQKDVRPFLGAADIFVLPSKTEGISNALLEGMAAGLACLVTPVGGNLDVVESGKSGLYIPVGDVSAWSDGLIKIAQNDELRSALGNAARRRIQETYDFEVVGAQYESLYRSLLDRRTDRISTG